MEMWSGLTAGGHFLPVLDWQCPQNQFWNPGETTDKQSFGIWIFAYWNNVMQILRNFPLSWCHEKCRRISKMIMLSTPFQHTVFQPTSLVCSGYFTLLWLKLSHPYSCFVFLEHCTTAGSCRWFWPLNSLEIIVWISKPWPFLSPFKLLSPASLASAHNTFAFG